MRSSSQVPDYYNIVKNPIDLQTMENKCISEQYESPQRFVDDIALMFDNAELYNKVSVRVSDPDCYIRAAVLENTQVCVFDLGLQSEH